MQRAHLRDSRIQSNEEDDITSCCTPVLFSEWIGPIEINNDSVFECSTGPGFFSLPFFGPLILENRSSDARDHCANERTFLSYLRLSVYMAIVAVAIVLSFHLKSQPSAIELRMARPLGIIFWLLALACLLVGFGNYMQTVNKYSRKVAIVQTGWRTQSIMSLVALAIIATCVVLLVVAKIEDMN